MPFMTQGNMLDGQVVTPKMIAFFTFIFLKDNKEASRGVVVSMGSPWMEVLVLEGAVLSSNPVLTFTVSLLSLPHAVHCWIKAGRATKPYKKDNTYKWTLYKYMK